MQSSLGFSAKDMMGGRFVGDENDSRMKRPANYNMSKTIDSGAA